MFNLAPIYSARKSPNHKLSTNHKISHDIRSGQYNCVKLTLSDAFSPDVSEQTVRKLYTVWMYNKQLKQDT